MVVYGFHMLNGYDRAKHLDFHVVCISFHLGVLQPQVFSNINQKGEANQDYDWFIEQMPAVAQESYIYDGFDM